jgi:hypothetical protein
MKSFRKAKSLFFHVVKPLALRRLAKALLLQGGFFPMEKKLKMKD